MPCSLLTAFDDLMNCTTTLSEASDSDFFQFALDQDEYRIKWQDAVLESQRLQLKLKEAQQTILGLEVKLNHARHMLDKEKQIRTEAERCIINLERNLYLIKDCLIQEFGKEAYEKFNFLSSIYSGSCESSDTNRQDGEGSAKPNTNSDATESTGSMISHLGYSHCDEDDDGDNSMMMHTGKTWRRYRSSLIGGRDSERILRCSHLDKHGFPKTTIQKLELNGTSTVMDTAVTKTALVEKTRTSSEYSNNEERINRTLYIPTHSAATSRNNEPSEICNITSDSQKITHEAPLPERRVNSRPSGTYPIGLNKLHSRSHVFSAKTVLCSEYCESCAKKMNFGKFALKCQVCKISCHLQCREQVSLPCVPVPSGNVPYSRRDMLGTISDYAPSTSPMVPPLIIHCVNEVDLRGFDEIGIYRIPGSEKETKELKEKFLRGKGIPDLADIDIHIICGVIKQFLRTLSEPLITYSLWEEFTNLADITDPEDSRALVHEAVSKLPQPNRDTLAFIVSHLQRVAECPDCKMPASNLAKVFGPTIVGYSKLSPGLMTMLQETKKQELVLLHLMNIPNDYWASFVNVDLE